MIQVAVVLHEPTSGERRAIILQNHVPSAFLVPETGEDNDHALNVASAMNAFFRSKQYSN